MSADLRAFDALRDGWGEPDPFTGAPQPPTFASAADEQTHRLQRLAAAYRIFGRLGFKEGIAGHITARDAHDPELFWCAPFGHAFERVSVSSLVCVDAGGKVVRGRGPINRSAFAIHSRVHAARPDVMATAHAHGLYGKTFSTMAKTVRPLTQDACAFFEDHARYAEYGGVAYEVSEGDRIAEALGATKAVILANHGHLTVGHTVDEAAWWFITMERTFQSQMLAESVGEPIEIDPDVARRAAHDVGDHAIGWFNFQPLYEWIVTLEPALLE